MPFGHNRIMPHMQLRKIAYFLRVFSGGKLISNEYQTKWPMIIDGKRTTYNPDYFWPDKSIYIEVVTSPQNISEQGKKWRTALADGRPLVVYWWDGTDITDIIARQASLPIGVRKDRSEDLPELAVDEVT
jgi:hypothetical protein